MKTVCVLLIVVAVCSCRSVPTVPAPVLPVRFAATSPNNANRMTPPRDLCWVAGDFTGTALLRGDELELVVPRAWIAVTRDNDKQWDDLHLVIEVSAHAPGPAHWGPVTRSLPVALAPTVDSAFAQLTTWEAADTLRLLVPWHDAAAPRWLFFKIQYMTLTHGGRHSECGGELVTDTLRFHAIGTH
jgi:hypothetical protein